MALVDDKLKASRAAGNKDKSRREITEAREEEINFVEADTIALDMGNLWLRV
jgi:hypothetical protein